MYILLRIYPLYKFLTNSIIFPMIGYRLLQNCGILQKFDGKWKDGIAISIFSKTAET